MTCLWYLNVSTPICLTFFVHLPILNKLEDFHENKSEQRQRQEFI